MMTYTTAAAAIHEGRRRANHYSDVATLSSSHPQRHAEAIRAHWLRTHPRGHGEIEAVGDGRHLRVGLWHSRTPEQAGYEVVIILAPEEVAR